MFKKLFLVAFFSVVFTYYPDAIESTHENSEKLITRNLRLTNTDSSGTGFDQCESSITSFMRKWHIQGASIAVAKDGKLLYAKGFGFADTASKTETQPFSKFRIASVSKLVTAVAIMKLQENGKLSVNDRVFGPEGILNDSIYCYPKDKRAFNITIAHLLSHEGGWTTRWGDQMFMPQVVANQMHSEMPVDTKTIVRFALSKRLHFTPGTGRAYSNLGYSILGLVIEKVAGVSYGEYCRKEILEPIGIYDMMLAKNLFSQRAQFEVTYYEPEGRPLKQSIYGTGNMVPVRYGGNDIEALGGAGDWLGTAPDLMRLLLAVDGFSNRPDFLSHESIRFMTDSDSKYAPVGWKSTLINGTWTRTGSFSGTAAMMKRQPDGVSWVVLLNTSTWNGPEIHPYLEKMMTRFIAAVSEWPEMDLFAYSLPVPVKVGLSGIN